MAAATDDYSGFSVVPSGPCRHAAAVTPSDTVARLAAVSRFLFVGGAGTLTVIMEDGAVVLFTGVLAGSVLPIQVSQVKNTGTTCANVVALW